MVFVDSKDGCDESKSEYNEGVKDYIENGVKDGLGNKKEEKDKDYPTR